MVVYKKQGFKWTGSQHKKSPVWQSRVADSTGDLQSCKRRKAEV